MIKFINISVTLLIAISMSMFTACKKKETHCSGYSMATEDAIQGTWLHQYPENTKLEADFSSPTRYQIKFEADSFFLTKSNYTDMISPTCNEFTYYFTYYAGIYQINNEVLSLKGLQTGSEFDSDPATIDTCYFYAPSGQDYTEDFGIYFCNNNLTIEVYKWKGLEINAEYWYYVRMKRE